MKSHPGFERRREAKSISHMLVASAMISVAISAWGCSSLADSSHGESVDDWNPNPYASFRYSLANISDTSDSVDSVAYGDLEDDSAGARSGYTDPSWEVSETRSESAVEAFLPVTDNRVLEIPQALSWEDTAAAVPIPGAGD